METTREHIKKLYQLVDALNKLHPHRNFTPDGILVGSIGEVLAEYHYGLSPLPPGTTAHDCSLGSLLIQVKTTQRASIQIGEPCQHLLALKLLPNGTIEEIYNGPGEPVWALVKHKKLPKNGLYQVGFSKLKKVMATIPEASRLKRAKL